MAVILYRLKRGLNYNKPSRQDVDSASAKSGTDLTASRCGSELARDGGSSVNISASRNTAFASKLAPTGTVLGISSRQPVR
ncbi:hypothetical protein F7R20_11255 [Pseudomonas brassicacearum subsp. brassicacearum]|nr:hypothetical protein F7R20_11255 [Pseudomonas brassicacearum subsp. brassicacearum]QEO78710.1 hypothetical protein ELZ14_14485 [Pseudomonas brassicacearum]